MCVCVCVCVFLLVFMDFKRFKRFIWGLSGVYTGFIQFRVYLEFVGFKYWCLRGFRLVGLKGIEIIV